VLWKFIVSYSWFIQKHEWRNFKIVQRQLDKGMSQMKHEVLAWPSVVCDDLVQSVDQIICGIWHFKMSEHSWEFPQIWHIILYDIITVGLGYHKFCQRLVLKMPMGKHKMWRMPPAWTSFEWHHRYGDYFLSHNVHVTSNGTWCHFWMLNPKSIQNIAQFHQTIWKI
jgi:hypothetical protein